MTGIAPESPSDIIAKLKGVTSRRLGQEFLHLKHLPSLWTRSYFVSAAGNVTSEIVKRHGEEQKTRQGIEIKNAPVASKHIVIEPVQ